MKIVRVSLWHVPLTSHETYYMADGKTCDTVLSVVLRIDTDTGLSGWGRPARSRIICPPTPGALFPQSKKWHP